MHGPVVRIATGARHAPAIASFGGEQATVKQIGQATKLKDNKIQPIVAALIDKGPRLSA